MVHVYRLIALMLAGGFCGLAAFSFLYVQGPDAYGYSVAEYQRWSFVGIITGAFAGLGTELAVRIAQRPHRQFSIRELLIMTALVAMALVIIAGLVQWARVIG